MSMGLYILSAKTLATIRDWQRAIDAQGFDLKLATERALENVRGGLPVVFNGKQTVFSCDPLAVSDVLADWSELRCDPKWTSALVLRWGADIDAGAAAYAAGASYAKAVDGRLLDGEEGKIITAKRGFEIAREMDASRSQIEEVLRMIAAQYHKG